MKFFGKPIQELFKGEKKVTKEQNARNIETVEDLKDFYDEFGGTEWAEKTPSQLEKDWYANNLKVFTDDNEQEDYDYWQSEFSPEMTDFERAEDVAGEDETTRLDNEGLSFILSRDDNGPKPEIEEENPHTAFEDLDQRDAKRARLVSEKFRNKSNALPKRETPADLPIEKAEEVLVQKELVSQQERVKPEVIVDLEQKEQVSDEYAKFKRAKEAAIYLRLVKNNPDLEKLRPKRGPRPLSIEEIKEEIALYGDKKVITVQEQQFIDQCKAWIGVTEKVKEYKGKDFRNPDGSMMTQKELYDLQSEYYELGDTNPKKFSLMNLEFFAEPKVESGQWKKAEFTWSEEIHKGTKQWVCQAGTTKYISNNNPTSVADLGQPAKFFYTIRREFPPTNKGKLVIVELMLPIPLDPNRKNKSLAK